MAKSRTPAKRIKQAEKNRLRNKSYKSRLKNLQAKYEASLKENDFELAKDNLLQLTSAIDRSVNKGILHKNTAARKKSKLTKKLQALANNQ